jgi:hypothetical protein
MPINKIYHPAALAAGIAYFVWGWLWYAIFGSQWLYLIHKTQADINAGNPVPYIVSFAMGLCVAYATAIALSRDDTPSVQHGVQFGAFMGISLIATTMLVNTLFEGRPAELWLISAGYPVTGLMIVGAIVGGWKKPHPTLSSS